MSDPLIEETEYSKMFNTTGLHRQIIIVPEPKADPTYPAPPETPFFIVDEVAPSEYYPLGFCTVTMYEFRDWKPWHKKKAWFAHDTKKQRFIMSLYRLKALSKISCPVITQHVN